MRACRYCYADTELKEGVCMACWKTIQEARPIDDKEMELWET